MKRVNPSVAPSRTSFRSSAALLFTSWKIELVENKAVMRRSGQAVDESDNVGDAESVARCGRSLTFCGKHGEMVTASIVSLAARHITDHTEMVG
jgi:hypothetical protein